MNPLHWFTAAAQDGDHWDRVRPEVGAAGARRATNVWGSPPSPLQHRAQAMTGDMPVAATYDEVAELLRDMAARVEAGDSLEGSIQWSLPEMPEHETPGGPEVMVRAAYRIGNLDGQGGVRIIGSHEPSRTRSPEPPGEP